MGRASFHGQSHRTRLPGSRASRRHRPIRRSPRPRRTLHQRPDQIHFLSSQQPEARKLRRQPIPRQRPQPPLRALRLRLLSPLLHPYRRLVHHPVGGSRPQTRHPRLPRRQTKPVGTLPRSLAPAPRPRPMRAPKEGPDRPLRNNRRLRPPTQTKKTQKQECPTPPSPSLRIAIPSEARNLHCPLNQEFVIPSKARNLLLAANHPSREGTVPL